VTSEEVKIYKDINYVSYLAGTLGLIIWLLMLARIIYNKLKIGAPKIPVTALMTLPEIDELWLKLGGGGSCDY